MHAEELKVQIAFFSYKSEIHKAFPVNEHLLGIKTLAEIRSMMKV